MWLTLYVQTWCLLLVGAQHLWHIIVTIKHWSLALHIQNKHISNVYIFGVISHHHYCCSTPPQTHSHIWKRKYIFHFFYSLFYCYMHSTVGGWWCRFRCDIIQPQYTSTTICLFTIWSTFSYAAHTLPTTRLFPAVSCVRRRRDKMPTQKLKQ